MQAHIVLAHPEPKSFNGHLALTTKATLEANGWSVSLSDLYAVGFDPREGPAHYSTRKDSNRFDTQAEQRYNAERGSTPLDVETERDRLLGADLLIVHFPLWWFGPPAMLKGWIDRVFVYGSVYRSTLRHDTGICRGKQMIACVTTGSSAEACSHDGQEGDTRLHIWSFLYSFRYIGFDVLEPHVFHDIGSATAREARADGPTEFDEDQGEWRDTLASLPARMITPYNADGDFDAAKRLVPKASVYSPFVARCASSPWS